MGSPATGSLSECYQVRRWHLFCHTRSASTKPHYAVHISNVRRDPITSIKTLSLKLHVEISGFLTSDVDHLAPNDRKSLIRISPDQSRNAEWTFQKCEIIFLKIVLCSHSLLTLAVSRRTKIQRRETLSSYHTTVFFYLLQIWKHILNRIFYKKTASTEV